MRQEASASAAFRTEIRNRKKCIEWIGIAYIVKMMEEKATNENEKCKRQRAANIGTMV